MKDAVLLLLCAIALADSFEVTAEQRRTCNCDPTEAEQICEANFGNDNVVIAHENCNKFYLCANGKPVAQNCPANLLYNPYLEQCDWPYNVDCGDRPISEDNDDDDDDIDNEGGDDNGIDSPGTCNCNPDEAPSICATEGSNGFLIAHQNCNQFYKCDQGVPVTFDCPPSLLYNPYSEQCDWPQTVECGDRVIPGPEIDDSVSDENEDDSDYDGICNCNPEEAPAICADNGSDGVLVAHENCDQFYICDHGKPVATTCPIALLYNPYTKQCDWPRNVDCGDRIVPEGDGCTACNEGNDVTPPCDLDNDSENSEEIPPAGDDPGNGNESPEEIPPAGDDPGNDNGSPEEIPPAGDDPGNDNQSPEEIPPAGDDPGNDNESPEEIPPAGDDPGNDNESPEEIPPVGDAPGNDNESPEEIPPVGDDPGNDSESPEEIPPAGDDPGNDNESPEEIPPAGDDPGNDNESPEEIPPAGDDPGNDNESPEEIPPAGDDPGNDNESPEEIPPAGDDPGNDNESPEEIPPAGDDSGNDNESPEEIPPAGDDPGNDNESPEEIPPAGDDPGNDNASSEEIPPVGDEPGNDNDGNDNDDGENGGTCNCNPEEAPAICASDDSSGVLVAHENCNQFYKCDHGKPVEFNCSGDLLYDPHKEHCDWPARVDCGDRLIPDPEDDDDNANDSSDIDSAPPVGDDPGNDNDGNDNDDGENGGTCNCNPEEAPAICASDDSSGVLVAHENCNQFYKCDQGKPVEFNCSGDLLYDPRKEQCDWSARVDCGDRLIPDPEDDDDSANDSSDIDSEPPAGDDPGNDNDDNGNEDGENGGTCNCNPDEAPSICASEDSSGVLIAHEYCNQFYKCDYGKPVEFNCSGDLLYDPYKEQCDWPARVDCGDRLIPDTEDNDDNANDSSDIDSAPPAGDEPGNDNDEDLPPIGDDPGNDSNEDLPPSGDAPDNDNEGNDPDDSDCDVVASDENTETCNCNPDEAPSICADDGSDGILVAHEYCTHFYKCDNGKPVSFKCGSNLLYNPVIQGCDWAYNVQCDDRVIPDSEEDDDNVSEGTEVDDNGVDNGNVTCNCNPEEAPAICAVSGSDGVQIAHENCNQFYQCSFGRPVAITCSRSLLYNPYAQVCDWPANVECGDRVIPDFEDSDQNESDDDDNESADYEINDDPSQAPTICAGTGSDGTLVAHENCNQFYTCSGGLPVALSCSGQLLFNPQINNCDWPRNVDCGDRLVPGNDNDCACNPRNAPSLCARQDSYGKLIAHENCNQFYMCINGEPLARDCPANLHYNIDKEVCDWPQNVNCESRMVFPTSFNKHLESRQALRK